MPVTRWRVAIYSVLSAALISATLAGSLFWTDDAFPFAPFRMFSYANSASGVVREMSFEVTESSGEEREASPAEFGLRRAELEEQTPWNETVPPKKMESLAESFNSQSSEEISQLRVVVTTTQLVDGVPQPEVTTDVIGEWISP